MPRQFVGGHGLKNTEAFPYPAREHARQLGLYGSAIIWDNTLVDDGAGDADEDWAARDPAVPARIDPLVAGAGGTRGGAVDENSTHIVSLYGTDSIDTGNRIEIEGRMWIVTAERDRTDRLINRVEVKGL